MSELKNWIIFSQEHPFESDIKQETEYGIKAQLETMSEEDQKKHRIYPFDDFFYLAQQIMLEANFGFGYGMDMTTAKELFTKLLRKLYNTEKIGLSMIKQHLNLPAYIEDEEIITALKKNDNL